MNNRLIPWAIAAIYLLFLFPTPEFPPYNADDGAFFVTLGWNLAQYGRYTVDTYPLAEYGHHASWPPLFPGLLGGVIKVIGLNWMILKLVMVLFGLAALLLLRQLWPNDRFGAWAVLLTALSPAIFLYSHHTMTEMPYIAAVAAVLWGLTRAESATSAFLVGLLAAIAFFTRGYAVIFLPASALYFALRPWPWRQRLVACAAFAAPLLIAILAWKGYTSHVLATQPLDLITTRYGNYGSGAGMLDTLMRSPWEYAQRLYWHELRYPTHMLLPVLPLDWVLQHDLSIMLWLILLTVAGYGWWHLFRQRQGPVECWLPLALAASLVVPRYGGARYWLTFLPFLYYYLLHGADEIGRRVPRLDAPLRAFPWVLSIVVSTALVWHLAAPDRLRFVTPDSKDYRDVALWAGTHLPDDAVVQAPAPARFLAASGLATWSTETLPQEIRASGRPLYLLCSPSTPAELCADLTNPVIRQGHHSLYRIAQ